MIWNIKIILIQSKKKKNQIFSEGISERTTKRS